MLPDHTNYRRYNRKDAMKKRSLAPALPALIARERLSAVFARRWRSRLGTILAGTMLLAVLNGCTSEPSKPAESKPEVKGPDLLAGRSAFQKVFVAARGWAQDAKPYRIDSLVTSDGGNGHDGKWALWRGGFASPAQRSVKTYTWSGSSADGAPARGVNPNPEDSYNPTNSSTQVFDVAFLKIDSDQAFATAQKHGGDKVLEKDPDTPVTYVCDWNHNTNELVWHVIYGASRESAKLTVAVNASTGDFIRVEK
jgi:hypothetical protein